LDHDQSYFFKTGFAFAVKPVLYLSRIRIHISLPTGFYIERSLFIPFFSTYIARKELTKLLTHDTIRKAAMEFVYDQEEDS